MRIDGKALSETILTKLSDVVSKLTKAGVNPTMAVILVGDDAGSLSYIRQKQKAATRIGANVIFDQMEKSTTPEILASAIAHYNNDPSVHGLIVQRPVPLPGVGDILNSVTAGKDVDGFIPNSPFEVPVARAVFTILEQIHSELTNAQLIHLPYLSWLNSQKVAIIGRGETAGEPIAHAFQKYDCATSIIHSTTKNRDRILKQASLIVSCVGKEHLLTKNDIKPGTMLISVGFAKGADGKLHGDYDETDIADTAAFYTPTPGGVGPINVACLMQNLVDACIMNVDAHK